MNNAENDQEFERLLGYLKHNRGFDFTGYKRSSLRRRFNKRMQEISIESPGGYLDYLEVHPDEFTHLFNTILINVTAFRRDAPAWNYLAEEIIPKVLAEKSADEPIRVWSAGCASGEEAYTLAILLAEAVGIQQFRQRVKIYATDVDEEALTEARHPSYTAKDLQPLATELRNRYFERVGSRYTFRNDMRRSIIFGRHDLVQDAPISRLDLLVCRNTLMYFNAETQARILVRLHFALKDQGFLFLGKAEMLLTHTDLFTPVNLKYRIFSKLPKLYLRNHMLVLAQAGNEEISSRLARQMRLQEIAFDAAPVAQILVDSNSNLVLANNRARSLFGLHAGAIGRPFRDVGFSDQPLELPSLIDRVAANHRPISLTHVEWPSPNGETCYFDVQVMPLLGNGGGLMGISISFADVTRTHQLQVDLHRTTQDLETAYEELQSTNEELETTNEELQSSNEELETTNEELQSTNEELETMNEELQSTNEELQTMNDELRERTDELNRSNAFQRSILTGLGAGVVVLDRTLNIRTWNESAEDLWGLRADEVKGQSFFYLDIGLPVDALRGLIRAVLAEESEHEEVVLSATNRRGKTIRCRIACGPLMGAQKEIQGVILLMEEWAPHKVENGKVLPEEDNDEE